MIELLLILVEDFYVRYDEEEGIIFIQHANDDLPSDAKKAIDNNNCFISNTSKIESGKYLSLIAPIRKY